MQSKVRRKASRERCSRPNNDARGEFSEQKRRHGAAPVFLGVAWACDFERAPGVTQPGEDPLCGLDDLVGWDALGQPLQDLLGDRRSGESLLLGLLETPQQPLGLHIGQSAGLGLLADLPLGVPVCPGQAGHQAKNE